MASTLSGIPSQVASAASRITGGLRSGVDEVARGLLGDEFVNQFGDTIGARAPSIADRLRDFTIASTEGLGRLEQLRAQQQDAFEKRRLQADRAALARQQEARKLASAAGQAIKLARSVPAGSQLGVLKEQFEMLGIPISSAAAKLAADADFMGDRDINDLVSQATDPNSNITIEEIQQIFGDVSSFATAVNNLKRARSEEIRAGNLSLDFRRKQIKAQQEATDFAARAGRPSPESNLREAAELEIRARESGQSNEENPRFGIFKGQSTEKVRKLGLRGSAKPPGRGGKTKATGFEADIARANALVQGGSGSAPAPASAGGGLPRVRSITQITDTPEQ